MMTNFMNGGFDIVGHAQTDDFGIWFINAVRPFPELTDTDRHVKGFFQGADDTGNGCRFFVGQRAFGKNRLV